MIRCDGVAVPQRHGPYGPHSGRSVSWLDDIHGDVVAQLVECWTGDTKVTGSILGQSYYCLALGKIVYSTLPQSTQLLNGYLAHWHSFYAKVWTYVRQYGCQKGCMLPRELRKSSELEQSGQGGKVVWALRWIQDYKPNTFLPLRCSTSRDIL